MAQAAIGTAVMGGLEKVLEPMTKTFSILLDTFKSMLPIGDTLEHVFDQFQPISDLFSTFGEIISTGFQPLVEWLMENFQTLIPIVQEVADVIKALCDIFIGAPGATNEFTSALQKLINDLVPVVEQIAIGILMGIASAAKPIADAFTAIMGALVVILQDPVVQKSLTDALTAVIQAVGEMIGASASAAEAITVALIDVIKAVNWNSVGDALVQSIMGGIFGQGFVNYEENYSQSVFNKPWGSF